MKKILSLFLVSISCSLNAQQLFSSKMEKEDITKFVMPYPSGKLPITTK